MSRPGRMPRPARLLPALSPSLGLPSARGSVVTGSTSRTLAHSFGDQTGRPRYLLSAALALDLWARGADGDIIRAGKALGKVEMPAAPPRPAGCTLGGPAAAVWAPLGSGSHPAPPSGPWPDPAPSTVCV